MGNKTNPTGLRLGYNRFWNYTTNEKFPAEGLIYETYLRDILLKNNYLPGRFYYHKTPHLLRISQNVTPLPNSTQPELKTLPIKLPDGVQLYWNMIEKPEHDAQTLAHYISHCIKKDINYMQKLQTSKKHNKDPKGIRLKVSGRIRGAEMAQTEKHIIGTVPLNQLDIPLDEGKAEALTKYGIIGIHATCYQ